MRISNATQGATPLRHAPLPSLAPDAGVSRSAERKRIVFVINSLTGGGAERVTGVLLSGLRDRLCQHEVHLVLLDQELARYRMPEYVRVHQLDARQELPRTILQLFAILRKLAPDLVVSSLERANVASVVCSLLLRFPTVVCEHIHTSAHLGPGLAGALKRLAVRATYPAANKVIAVSSGIRDDLIGNFAVPADKAVVITNPLDRDRIVSLAAARKEIPTPQNYAVAIGRMVPAKNFPLLVEAFSRVPDFSLVILGEGPGRAELQQLVDRQGLSDRVILPGFVQNPYPIIAGATCFVSASNVEGFPMALLEAMCLGRPIIATDCPTGPAEILCGRDGPSGAFEYAREFGVLVPMRSVEALVKALDYMTDAQVRAHYSRKATERSLAFDATTAGDKYFDAIRPFLNR